MIIKEAFMKNFGKFHNERIEFQQGINIVYGGNESGKTTLYTFLQGVFSGSGGNGDLLPEPIRIRSVFPGKILPGMREVFCFRQERKIFVWNGILKKCQGGGTLLCHRWGKNVCAGRRSGNASGRSYPEDL